ncbi:hypothetical protein OF363_00520 [Mycoplasma enhydrae]|uniref:hypothetical protein n=1 Tax=Mycoplasma enhydrae TaxID=2499220 RepID=UPI0021E90445|nr:hypothetical protein [Mycoplasma enhydrae]MCV3733521.1 hypothetical protein [Mycoplasma enhydrae]
MKNIDLSSYNTTDELYVHNSKKFNLWWILFTVFLGIVVILMASTVIEYTIRKEHYINNYIELIESLKNKPDDTVAAANSTYLRETLFSVFTFIISVGILIWHIINWVRGIRKKDYSLYSPFLSALYGFLVVFMVINLIWSFGSIFQIPSWNVKKMISLVYTIVLPIGYFVFYWPCAKIIRMFRFVKMQAQMQNMPQEFLSPFGNRNMNPEVITPTESNPNMVLGVPTMEKSKTDVYREQLNTLDNEKLVLMAKKLNIFGAEDLSRENLIEKIVLIFETDLQNQKSSDLKPNTETKNEDPNFEDKDEKNPTDD